MLISTAHHKRLLVRILKDIYGDTAIGPALGFKGGTAVYVLYHLDRFSVDLDFDLLDEKKTDEVFEKIVNILKNYGVLREKSKKKNTLFFMLSYEERSQNIKIEINRRNMGSHYEVKSFLGIAMKVMVKEDMFAHKLVAMAERIGKSNRDIFDVHFFLQNNWPINKTIVEARTKMKFRPFLQKCIKSLEKMSDRGILAGIGHLLDEKKKNWCKVNLRKDTIFLLKLLKETTSA
jgi:predicted nucleotidyltransferase component of viral defense system